MNVLALCAGIGGLDLGVRITRPDARVVCYVEKKEFAVKILQCRMRDGCLDDAPVWDDLCTFDPEPWRRVVDCIVAGYPCQPFSSAARGHHTEQDLSEEVLRIIEGVRPSIVFIENVYHARRSLAGIRRRLDGMGYHCPPLLEVRASDVGAPHQRKRLFLAAYADGYRKPGLQEHAEMAGVSATDQSFWEDHSVVVRVADGTAAGMDRARLDVCGNAVVPLAAAYAWRILEDGLEE